MHRACRRDAERTVRKYLLALSAWMLMPAVAVAGPTFETGTTLLAACNAPNLSHHWYCLGYVASVADLQLESGYVCLPPGATKSDLKRVVTRYLEAHPAALHEPASRGVIDAMTDAFPCT